MPPILDDPAIDAYRQHFPITQSGKIYLNHAGVGPTSIQVCDAVNDWMRSLAAQGVAFNHWEEQADECRGRFARLINCEPDEVAFIRNTSHGLALIAEGVDWQPGERIIITPDVEYPSNVYPWRHVAKDKGLFVDELPSKDGGADIEAIGAAITPQTRLIAVSSAQFGTGAVTDLAALGKLCKANNILFCVDGIQTLGAIPMDVKALGIDFVAADSHKWLLGMSGIGGLYIRKALIPQMRPALVGWKSVKKGWAFKVTDEPLLEDSGRFEEGSPSYPLINGFNEALKLLEEVSIAAIANQLETLIDHLARGLEQLGCNVSPPPHLRHHILIFSHPHMDNTRLRANLEDKGIFVTDRGAGLRASPHFYNTLEEMDKVIDAVTDCVS